jgi:hypothetical protein
MVDNIEKWKLTEFEKDIVRDSFYHFLIQVKIQSFFFFQIKKIHEQHNLFFLYIQALFNNIKIIFLYLANVVNLFFTLVNNITFFMVIRLSKT